MTLIRSVAVLFAGLVLALTVAGPARAAEISIIQLETFDDLSNLSIDVDIGLGFNLAPDGDIRCNYLLHGPIAQGDLDRVKAAIKPFADRNSNKIPRVCLNSPGGNYQEGLRIAQYFMAENIGTAVPAGAGCYSACSFMFMGGTYPWKGEINRFQHVLGNVGFHAPYLGDLPDEAYDKKLVAEAYSEGVKAMRILMDLGVGNAVKRFPPELMHELMGKGADELFGIDTVGKAIRFRVHLYGAALSQPLDHRAWCNACVNMNYGAMESYGSGAETDLCKGMGPDEERRVPQGRRLVYSAAPRGGTCEIDVEEKAGKVASWTYLDKDDAQWKDGLELAYWYLTPPNTPIHALSDKKPDVSMARADGSIVEIPKEPEVTGQQQAGGTLEDALVRFVVLDYLGHGKANHETPAAIFAPSVEYYGRALTREAVAADHASYYRKWPERKYQVMGDTVRMNVKSADTADVTFTYAFSVAGGNRTVSGMGETELTVKLIDGRFEITRETGRVLSKM